MIDTEVPIIGTRNLLGETRLKIKYEPSNVNTKLYSREVLNSAKRLKQDFSSKKVSNLHPDLNTKTRIYHSSAVQKIASDFWLQDATIPEPDYTKVICNLIFTITMAQQYIHHKKSHIET